ncbi:MAG: hypothetical protein DRP11_01015 [Candidatus Aenigmatarchaeota archaeon]|nr:MAG: hypothetical protein DRP11_01015 [Candidatus Aenigmarchaeota archaeon]
MIEDIQIVMPLGGFGTRLKHRAFIYSDNPDKPLPKHLIPFPSDSNKRLLDWTIELWKNLGFKRFIFLLGYGSDMIENYITSNISGINPKFSFEDKRLETGGAIFRAIENKTIDTSKPMVVHYADDLIIGFPEFPIKLIETHSSNRKMATSVFVRGRRYPFGTAEISGGNILKFREKEMVEKPTYTGISIFEPDVYNFIIRRGMDSGRFKLERTVLNDLASTGNLGYYFLPEDFENERFIWFPVNDEKGYSEAEKALKRFT